MLLSLSLLLSVQANPEALLESALVKLGGKDRVASLKSILLVGEGYEDRSVELQGPSPERGPRVEHRIVLGLDVSGQTFVYEHRTARHDGTMRHRRWIYGKDGMQVADFGVGYAGAASRHTAASRLAYSRRIPHLLLLEAAGKPGQLQSKGSRLVGGRNLSVVEFKPESGLPLLLMFDSEPRLVRVEREVDFPLLGKQPHSFEYQYQVSAELGLAPTKETIRLADRVMQEVVFKVATSDPAALKPYLSLPPDLVELLKAPGSVSEVAPRVHLVSRQNGQNLMFAEFSDHVVAMEAPALGVPFDNPSAGGTADYLSPSKEFLGKIRTVTDKPIRYVVLSHFHYDHAGGAKVFADEGATVVTTPGNEKLFRDAGIQKLELVRHLWRHSSGNLQLEVHSTGKNPHTDEMLFSYFPQSKILFEGDLFYYNGDELFPDRARLPIMRFFAGWLKQKGIRPDRIYDFHGQGFASGRHLDTIMAWPEG